MENDSRMTISLPAELKKALKISAAQNDRPLSKEILHRLKLGMEWKKQEAANAS